MKRTAVIASAVMAACLATAHARPLLTEDAWMLPAGGLSLEMGGDWMHDEPNFFTGRERDRLSGPDIRMTVAPRDGVELGVGWVVRTGTTGDPDTGDAGDWGDVTVRTKLGCGNSASGRVAFAVQWSVTLPETEEDKALGPNTIRFLGQALASADLGVMRVHANAGLAIQDQTTESARQDDFFAYGLALERNMAECFSLLAEINGLWGRGTSGTDEHCEARAGFRFRTGSFAWDVAVRRGLERADGSWGATAGLTWRME